MTEDEIFEERVRMIVRDELQAEWIEPGGYHDQVAKQTFNVSRAIIQSICEIVLRSLPDDGSGGPKK